VPGLSLAYLDRNIVVGNALIGVARPQSLLDNGNGNGNQISWLDDKLAEDLAVAADAAAKLAEIDDRTPDEVKASEAADAEVVAATRNLTRLFDLWTAEPFGVTGARQHASVNGDKVLAGADGALVTEAQRVAQAHRFLHWPLAFPGVFSGANPGFDAVVGNPPWNEVTIERLGFYTLYRPGLRGLPDAAREAEISSLLTERPELEARLATAQEEAATERRALGAGEYSSLPGDPDLYKYFCQRYQRVLREGGRLGVVLPRNAFAADGSAGFRQWLFEETTVARVDFLLNAKRWAFDAEPRYTVALLATERRQPEPDHRTAVAGTADSRPAWEEQVAGPGVRLAPQAFGPNWTTPLVRNQAEADLLAKVRMGSPFARGPRGRWQTFAVRDVDETNDKLLWQGATSGLPLWKGESFDQFEPHGHGARPCPDTPGLVAKRAKPRPGSGQLLATELSLALRRQAVVDELGRARVAFRDVSRATDSRTVRACLVPPEVVLTNTGPYLAFATGDAQAQAACVGIMNSLPFDWQARRFVETHLNFFVLDGLVVPNLSDAAYDAVARAAARLSCLDDRFAAFATATGVVAGPLTADERSDLRASIDAQVAHSWRLTAEEITVLFADFTSGAVPNEHRDRVLSHLASLA